MYTIQKVEWTDNNICVYTDIYRQDSPETLPAIGPKCSLEIGEAGSLQFTLPPGHPMIDSLNPVSTFVRLLDGEDEIFFGKVLQRSEPAVTGRVSFTCSGALSFLMDSEIPPFEKNSSGQAISQHWSAETFFRWCIDKHNEDIGGDPRRTLTVGIVSASKKSTESDYQITSFTQTKSAIESNIINVYGGYLRTRRDSLETLYIDWIQEYETEDAQDIELGVNLIDQTTQIDGTSFFTVIRPVGNDGITLTEKTVDLFEQADMALYGRIVKTIQFTGAANETDLRTQATTYKNTIQKMLFADVDVRFIDMHYLDGTTPKIRLGNRFTNIHGMTGIEMIAASLELNLDAPQNDSAALKNRRSLEGDLTPEGNLHSGKKLSSSSRKSAGQYFKYLKETGELLEVTAKQVSMHGDTLEQHYNQITTTANNVTTLSRRADTMEEDINPVKALWPDVVTTVTAVTGSLVLQNDYEIAMTVGSFEIGQTSTGRKIIRLKDGADLQVSDESGVIQTVGESIGRQIEKIEGVENFIDLFQGSALWTQREGITGVAGEFEVVTDPLTGTKTLVIKSGGGIKIRRGNVEYGLYDNGNLTGGILVEKLNAEGPVVTQIRGDLIDLSTNDGYTSILMTTTNIVSSVSRRARVFVQITDPSLESGISLMTGDIWVKSVRVQNWNDMESRNWGDAGSFNWNQYAGSPQFVWDGERWEVLIDRGLMAEFSTRIEQTETNITLLARAVDAIDPEAISQASIEISSDAITAAVSTAKSEIYSVIRQTATNIYSEVGNDISGVSSAIEQTASSLTAAIARKNKVFVQLTDPANDSGVTVIDGDVWIKSSGNGTVKQTWTELSAKSWTSQNSTNWREYYEGYWYVRKNGVWRRMNADADVTEIGTKIDQDEKQIALIARDVDEKHQELGSRLTVTAREIRSEVHAAKSDYYSVIRQTATNIFSGVYDKVGQNFSTIEQTSTAIKLAVASGKSELYNSVIAVTSTSISLSVAAGKSALYNSVIAVTSTSISLAVASGKSALYNSVIEVTSTKITVAVAAGKSALYNSVIAVTATSIDLAVSAGKSALYNSVIAVTATSIDLAVSAGKSALYNSVIAVTSTSISLAVSAGKSALYNSVIAVTSTSISQTVTNVRANLQSQITLQSNRIDLVVEGIGANAKIKPASIVASINEATGSEIVISATRIDLNGYVKASMITADYIAGKIAAIANMAVQTITSERGGISVYSVGTTSYTQGGVSCYVPHAITTLRLTQNGNTYTLQQKRFSDENWVDVGSFSRATTLSGAWGSNSNTYTVTASPQGDTHSVSPIVHVELPGSQPSANVKIYVATLTSGGSGYNDHGSATVLYLVNSGLNVYLRSVNSTSGGYTYAQKILSDANLKPANIRDGVTIFGVEGTYEGDSYIDKGSNWECEVTTYPNGGRDVSLTKYFGPSSSLPFTNGQSYHLYI